MERAVFEGFDIEGLVTIHGYPVNSTGWDSVRFDGCRFARGVSNHAPGRLHLRESTFHGHVDANHNVTCEGSTFRGAGITVSANDGGSAFIRNNEFHDVSGPAIRIYAELYAEIRDNRIFGATTGIYVDPQFLHQPHDIVHNQIEDCSGDEIRAD